MGRRKKEPKSVHRKNIADAAYTLFMQNGIDSTSMDDIAKHAKYSKATLYVYFENKKEIIGFLVLNSMKKLYEYISSALDEQKSTKQTYDLICDALVKYNDEFPAYFKMTLDKININFEKNDYLPEEKETYEIGELINKKLEEFFNLGIKNGDLRKDLQIIPTILNLWGMMSGIIYLSENKEEYVESRTKLSKNQFLKYGFDMLYMSIKNTEE